jgi:hypothetical protein
MNENEVIIKLGAEGGSVVLYGFRTERGWSFAMEVTELQVTDDDDEWVQNRPSVVDTWEAALKLLDKYPWFKLYPISVHPEFRQQVWDALQERLQSTTEIPKEQLQRWRKYCGVGNDTRRENSLMAIVHYITSLRGKFNEFRGVEFKGSEDLFETRKSGAVVFKPEHVELNLLIPPCLHC